MFSIGDIIVCIESFDTWDKFLKKNQVYTVTGNTKFVYVDNYKYGFCENRFILLKEFRKQKIKKMFKNS